MSYIRGCFVTTGEASASMASASPSREDDQIRKESHDGDSRKFPAPSDVASAAEGALII